MIKIMVINCPPGNLQWEKLYNFMSAMQYCMQL